MVSLCTGGLTRFFFILGDVCRGGGLSTRAFTHGAFDKGIFVQGGFCPGWTLVTVSFC